MFPRGLLIGVSVAAPVGPMAVLCIRRTLAFGRRTGLVSGSGIASADAVYAAVAAFGLTSITSLLVDLQNPVRLIGGVFLLYLGLTTFRSVASEVGGTADQEGASVAGAYFSTFGLTLTNPATILSFVAIFAGFGVAESGAGTLSAIALVAGVFLGSCLWWLMLITATGLMRSRLNAKRLTWLNRISGVVITTFGVVALVSLIR